MTSRQAAVADKTCRRFQITSGMPPKPRPIYHRFWAKVDKRGADECWPWLGAKTSAGYGHIWVGPAGGTMLAHRVAYLMQTGSIPDGLDLDHLCHAADEKCSNDQDCPHRSCVNPRHSAPTTRRTNVLRGHTVPRANAAKTHCVREHEFTPDNTRMYRGSRVCRECARVRHRKWVEANPNYVRPGRR